MKGSSIWLRIPPAVYRDLGIRLLLLGLVAGSVALIWWSVNRLPLVEKKLQQQQAKASQIESDIFKLELRWKQADADQVDLNFKQAQEQVFSGQEEFYRWQDGLKRQAAPFVLSVQAQEIKTQACPLPNKKFTLHAAKVQMQTPPGNISTNSPYQRLLDFTKNVTTQTKRVDLLELSVSGRSNSVGQASLGLQVWFQENIQ